MQKLVNLCLQILCTKIIDSDRYLLFDIIWKYINGPVFWPIYSKENSMILSY